MARLDLNVHKRAGAPKSRVVASLGNERTDRPLAGDAKRHQPSEHRVLEVVSTGGDRAAALLALPGLGRQPHKLEERHWIGLISDAA